jgi:hypothetical protein
VNTFQVIFAWLRKSSGVGVDPQSSSTSAQKTPLKGLGLGFILDFTSWRQLTDLLEGLGLAEKDLLLLLR